MLLQFRRQLHHPVNKVEDIQYVLFCKTFFIHAPGDLQLPAFAAEGIVLRFQGLSISSVVGLDGVGNVFVDGVGGDGIVYGAGHRAQGRLVQDVLNAIARLAAIVQVADVANDELKVRMGEHMRQVPGLAGGKVIEHNHPVVLRQQRINQVR